MSGPSILDVQRQQLVNSVNNVPEFLGMNKPIGISEYELTRALPEELKSALPTIEEIEAELSADLHDENEGEV